MLRLPATLAGAVLLAACVAHEPIWPQLPGPGIAVYAAGDIADCRHAAPADSGAARTAALLDAALAGDADALLLTLGDHSYPGGAAPDFARCYGPTWGRFRARTRPAPGNHDRVGGGAGYRAYFGPAYGGPFYSFEVGDWHLVSLDSTLSDAAAAAQLAWLQQDLAGRRHHCTLAYWHHPLYSSGGHGKNSRMRAAWRLLAAAGADLVLSGHDHDYERFAPQDADGRLDTAHGLRQFVVGTGGAALTPLLWPSANSELRANDQYGVLKLVLKEGGYEWRFLAAADAPQLQEHGAARCHQ